MGFSQFSQESLADQVRVLVKTASSEETIVLKPEVTEHEFHDLIPAAGAGFSCRALVGIPGSLTGGMR